MSHRTIHAAALVAAAILAAPAPAMAKGFWASVFGVAAGSVAGKAAGSAFSDADVTDKLKKMAVKINQEAPMRLDDMTRMDRVSVGPGRLVTYHNTITTMRSGEVNLEAFRGQFSSEMRRKICASSDLATLRRVGVTMVYAYSGSEGGLIGSVRIAPQDCA